MPCAPTRLPVVLALLAACASAPEAVPEDTASVESYFPLAVGNSWTYFTRFGKRVEQNTVSIVGRDGAAFVDSRDGRFVFDEEGLRDRDRYLVRTPLREGTSWKSVVDVGQVETYEIVDTDATVTVPAGTFRDALVVRGRSPVDAGTTLEVEWAYAPGVGLVRTRTVAVIGGKERVTQVVNELASYELNR